MPPARKSGSGSARTHAELDLCNQLAVRQFLADQDSDYIVLAAARVGGIHANNTYPAEFIYENLMMEAKVIHEAWRAGINELLFLGSSCIYPKFAIRPMVEKDLLINVGSGADVTMREPVEAVKDVIGFEGELSFDASKPSGPPRKLLDVSRLNKLRWRARIGLKEGLSSTYAWFLENRA